MHRRQRFDREDIQNGLSEAAAVKGGQQRGFHDQRATAGVQDMGAVRQQCQAARIQQSPRRGCVRQQADEDLGPAQGLGKGVFAA